MGLKDMFFGGGSGRGKTRAERLTKRATNQYAQSADRYGAMEDLLGLAAKTWDKALKLPEGTPERLELERSADDAYVGVLKRFTTVASKTIDDEEEKGWLYRRLTAIGKPMLGPIKRFVVEAEGVAWALRIVEDVASEEEEWEILDALLEAHPPVYERDSSPKLQTLTHLKEIDDPRVREILSRYLEDPDESVRFFCVEALVDNAEVESLDALMSQLGKAEEDSVRLRARILDGLADLGWDVSAHAEVVRKHLDDEHSFDGARVKRR
ncbi:HEAT repeat domain-containing protein [Pseudenhygromyxa sp. WMMC2535]|uniref:HEAT repeat domain-containing protein n=1 Tax=Pseudenhygromyxa sp. WMMC2535 TaxID=2712867 RepID=UPI0015550FB7|nr:HEAT repeat domain-containing protein [Pseudenhygromyxa sp. WMMC2535]NVB39931.1 HEAT repeat domain-containing protein [Pseudenhygromyxa sp. WMMC2535]